MQRTTIYTKNLDEDSFRCACEDMLQILSDHGVLTLDLLFGWAWEHRPANEQAHTTLLSNVMEEIEQATAAGQGRLGEDNVTLFIREHAVEIIWCHESDIHLGWYESSPLVDAIRQHWQDTGIFRSEITNKPRKTDK